MCPLLTTAITTILIITITITITITTTIIITTILSRPLAVVTVTSSPSFTILATVLRIAPTPLLLPPRPLLPAISACRSPYRRRRTFFVVRRPLTARWTSARPLLYLLNLVITKPAVGSSFRCFRTRFRTNMAEP
jgi:hypothetical protein